MSRTAMLTLDGEPIVMKSMRISVSMQFQDKDSSGQTSSTSSSEQGEKAKELDVSGLVPFNDERTLSRLFELADAKGDGGKRHIYRVGSLLAKSVKVRQAKFTGRITAMRTGGAAGVASAVHPARAQLGTGEAGTADAKSTGHRGPGQRQHQTGQGSRWR